MSGLRRGARRQDNDAQNVRAASTKERCACTRKGSCHARRTAGDVFVSVYSDYCTYRQGWLRCSYRPSATSNVAKFELRTSGGAKGGCFQPVGLPPYTALESRRQLRKIRGSKIGKTTACSRRVCIETKTTVAGALEHALLTASGQRHPVPLSR